MAYKPKRLKNAIQTSNNRGTLKESQAKHTDKLKSVTEEVPKTAEDKELNRIFEARDAHQRPTKAFNYDEER